MNLPKQLQGLVDQTLRLFWENILPGLFWENILPGSHQPGESFLGAIYQSFILFNYVRSIKIKVNTFDSLTDSN